MHTLNSGICFFVIFASISLVCASTIEEANNKYRGKHFETTDTDGVNYSGTIKKIEADGVIISYSDGVHKVRFKDMPTSLAEKYGYNKSDENIYIKNRLINDAAEFRKNNLDEETLAKNIQKYNEEQKALDERGNNLPSKEEFDAGVNMLANQMKVSMNAEDKRWQKMNAKRELDESTRDRFSDDSARNASIAIKIANSLKKYADVMGGKPEDYIPLEYSNQSYRSLIIKAINEESNPEAVIALAVYQNPGNSGNKEALSMANKLKAIREHDVHNFTGMDLQMNPGIPVPAVHGTIDSVTIIGKEYEVHTTDGRTHTGWFFQNVGRDGFGSTITQPSSGGSILTTVTPRSQIISW